MTEEEYRKAFIEGLRKAGEILWEAKHYDAAATLRSYLNVLIRGGVDLPVNAYDEAGL